MVRLAQAMVASRAMPQAWVLVIVTGRVMAPTSAIMWVPVISPLPFWLWKPANTGSRQRLGGRGRMAVTPVRTGPRPGTSGPSPAMRVV